MSGRRRRRRRAAACGAGVADDSAAGQAPSLLDLPDVLLERILGRLHQELLRCTIPLVCKRLDALLQDSTELWRELVIDVEDLSG